MGNRRIIHTQGLGASHGRAHRARVQQVVGPDVGGVVLLATDFQGNVFALEALAHNFVQRGVFGFGLAIDVQCVANLFVPLHGCGKGFATDQIGICDRFAGVGHGKHPAVVHRQPSDIHAQLERCGIEQHTAGFSSGIAQRHCPQSQTGAATATALVGRQTGVTHGDVDFVQRHVQFVGHNLGHRQVNALAAVHLAEIGHHAAIGSDADPGVQSGGRWAHQDRGSGLRSGVAHHHSPRSPDHQSGLGLQKIAAIEIQCVHVVPFKLWPWPCCRGLF